VCCSASLKHALTIQEKYPDTRIKIFYIDLRVTGRNEDFLTKVRENDNIELIKGKVACIEEIAESKNLIVEAEDIMAGRKTREEVDLVVLATGIIPSGTDFKTDRDPAGFMLEEQSSGFIPAGCSKKPMDVSSCVKDATAAALRAIQHVESGRQSIT
jgi:heterodisulfide reductase subunit A-like polyferredoxin